MASVIDVTVGTVILERNEKGKVIRRATVKAKNVAPEGCRNMIHFDVEFPTPNGTVTSEWCYENGAEVETGNNGQHN